MGVVVCGGVLEGEEVGRWVGSSVRLRGVPGSR